MPQLHYHANFLTLKTGFTAKIVDPEKLSLLPETVVVHIFNSKMCRTIRVIISQNLGFFVPSFGTQECDFEEFLSHHSGDNTRFQNSVTIIQQWLQRVSDFGYSGKFSINICKKTQHVVTLMTSNAFTARDTRYY